MHNEVLPTLSVVYSPAGPLPTTQALKAPAAVVAVQSPLEEMDNRQCHLLRQVSVLMEHRLRLPA